jgi:hypothetical protein
MQVFRPSATQTIPAAVIRKQIPQERFLMKCFNSAAAIVVLSTLSALTGCGGPAQFSYQNVTVAISPQVTSVPAGGTQVFSTTTVNAPNVPFWTLNNLFPPLPGQPSPYGTFTTATTDAPTGTYTAPATPPIYSIDQVTTGGYVQGSVTLNAAVANSLTSLFSAANANETFAIVGTVTPGFLTTTANVALGSTVSLYPYVVGSLNNAYSLQVNGFPGGGAAIGTISTAGLYTAPSAMPMSGSTITVTVISTADPTKNNTATITLH